HSVPTVHYFPYFPTRRSSDLRLSQIYHRKDDAKMIFQNNRHKQIFEAERLSMRKPGKKTLAVLYLLTADHTLWIKTKHLFTPNRSEEHTSELQSRFDLVCRLL